MAHNPQTLKVLIVDDHRPSAFIASMYMDMFGYDFDIAYSGQEAIQKYRERQYGIVLMDIQMSGLNGFDATKMIRDYEQSSGIPKALIIGITANTQLGDRERSVEAGMNAFLLKPIQEEMFRRILRR